MRALPAALIAYRHPSLLAAVLAGAFAAAVLRRPPIEGEVASTAASTTWFAIDGRCGRRRVAGSDGAGRGGSFAGSMSG